MRQAEAGLEIGSVLADRYEVRFLTQEAPAYLDYRVHDREVEVELALWRMDPVLFAGEEERAGFERAAHEMRGLVHPHLRRVFDSGRAADGAPYLTSQLGSTEGVALRLDSGRIASELDIMRYATAMADGLEVLHAVGYVHGHLVPADLVEVAGVIKVSGGGLYRGLDPALVAERWGDAGRYLAPEVLASGKVDRRADVFSMAAILCELAAGVSRPDLAEATEQLAADQLALADLLAHALSRAPERRPARPAELLGRIRRLFIDERVPTVKRPVLVPPQAHRTEKNPALEAKPEPAQPDPGENDGEGLTLEEASPLFLDPSAAPASPLFGPNKATLPGHPAPRGQPPPARPARSSSPPPRPSSPPPPRPPSQREPTPRQPRAPTARPPAPLQPRQPMPRLQRPVAPVPGADDSLAPFAGEGAPDSPILPAPGARGRLLLVIGLSAAALLGALAIALAPWRGDDGPDVDRVDDVASPPAKRAATPSPPPAPTPSPTPSPSPPPSSRPQAPSTSPCPASMAFMSHDLLDAAAEPYCIDRQEWPGAGKPPELGLSLAEAASRCQGRSARLCQPAEWEDACRGPDRSSFPYGRKYVDRKCNLRRDEIVAAGSFPECQSASGAFDMSGNAAEWDASGKVRGGSATDGTRGRCSSPRRRKSRDLAGVRPDIGFRCCADPLHRSPPPGKKRGPG